MKERLRQIVELLRRREMLVPLLIAVGGLFFAWFAVFGDQGLYQLHKHNKIKAEMQNEIKNLNKKIKDLNREKELLKDPSHLETVIRRELGYVKQGEVVFQQIGE